MMELYSALRIALILNNLDGNYQMDKVIHAHDLLDFIDNNSEEMSPAVLKIEFEKQHGKGVGFTNCTRQVYNFDEILVFLSQRNKIRSTENGIVVNKEHQCDHD